MTDKELLELAARAVGIETLGLASKWIAQGISEDDLLIRNNMGGDSVWNPLTNDGDALRLAVKLRMSFIRHPDGMDIQIIIPKVKNVIQEQMTLDENEGMRRAIVRAAAEIGGEIDKQRHQGY